MLLKYSSTCRMWVWILIVTIIIGMILFVFYPWKKIDTAVVGPFPLQEIKQVGDIQAAQKLLAYSNEGSIQMFVYPLPLQRTGVATTCSDNSSAASGEPNCDSGRFGICTCTGTDCSRCQHLGYSNILNISNVVRLEMLNAPDAARQNAAMVQLVVRTYMRKPANNTVEVVEETMVLPTIPFQRWTMITIARDARRYDVYYNDKLVSSKRTEKLIDVAAVINPISIGHPMLNGSAAYIQTFDSRLTQAQVSTNYHRIADTTGKPSFANDNEMITNLFKRCEGGNCLKGPAVRPTSPLLDWETSYA